MPVEELLTARQYAQMTGRIPRTVQGWVEDKKGEPQNVPGVVRVGRALAAPKETWDRIAASKGPQGRRDHEPRTKREPENPGTSPQ